MAAWVAQLNIYQLGLAPPVLNNAVAVSFLVSGVEKAETLRAILIEC